MCVCLLFYLTYVPCWHSQGFGQPQACLGRVYGIAVWRCGVEAYSHQFRLLQYLYTATFFCVSGIYFGGYKQLGKVANYKCLLGNVLFGA